MVVLVFIGISVVFGCLLYLPFFLWFRRHRPSGDGPLAAKMSYTPAGWAFVVGQLIFLSTGLFLGKQDPASALGQLVQGNTGILKWLICTLVLASVADTLLRGAGIALRRSPEAMPTAPSAATHSGVQRVSGVRLATIFGAPVVVHRSFLFGGLCIALVARTDAQGVLGYCVAYAALFAIHEFGHAAAARSLGLKVHSVDLAGIGGLCRVDWPQRDRDVWLVYSAGLAAQAVVLLSTLVVVAARGAPQSSFGLGVTTTFTWVNGMLFLLNLVPGRTYHGLLNDGGMLWGMARHQFGSAPHPAGLNLVGPHLVSSRQFDPSTSLLTIEGLTPEGFHSGVEILNDSTTPMQFVVDMLQQHGGLDLDTAVERMLEIHVRGGVLLPCPSREAADAVADAIARDAQAQGHRLVCRAVTATA